MSARDDPETLYGKRYRIFYPVHIRKSKSVFVPDSESWYKMSAYPRGKMIIINTKHFNPSTGLDKYPREGSGTDVEALVNLFLKLGYIIEVYDDLKKSEVMRTMTKASTASYKDYGAFVCAFLTHGEEKTIYAVDGSIEIRKITKMFCGPKLVGIPKIILIQACRGVNIMPSIDECDGEAALSQRVLSLPEESDFLYAYSTISGYSTLKNSKGGSWFIQAVCNVFKEHAKDMDIMRMLTKVNDLVAKERSTTRELESADMRQIASVVSQLRKEFYFFPPYSR